MADGQHKLSRRALLGAVCAMPVLSEVEGPLVRHATPRHSGLDPESTFSSPAPEGRRWIPDQVRDDDPTTIWDRALARLQSAQTVLDAAKSEPDQDAYDALLDSHSDALSALLALPAPDLAAVAAKLDLIVAQQAWELTGGEAYLAGLQEDARRLGSG
ncbi:MAG: hypothetical protein QOG72_1240 [Sphingomonadales bacterium]|jgi:hypothetical protein|nr:hypothetical protein [Sphingomonadales bacterium]